MSTNVKKANSLKRIQESRLFSQLMPVGLLILLILLFGVLTGGKFTQPANLKIVLEQALIVGTVSTGAAFIFASGNVNLAMGATTLLTATLAGLLYKSTGSLVVMIISAIVLGVVMMAISALLSTLLGVRVMFVTIVMMTLLVAIQQSILGGSSVAFPYAVISDLANKGFMYIGFGLYFIFCVVLFHFTDIGRALRFLGTNTTCAEQTGLTRKKYLLLAFIIAGIGCGVGALLAIVRAGSISTSSLSSLNMDCMLALVLGGMSIFGGSRSYVYSGIIGAVTVVVLNQGLLMIGVDATIIQAIRGIVFLTLVTISQVRPKGLPAPEG